MAALIGLTLTAPASAGAIRYGDVNTDGSVDVVDALLVAQYYVGLDPAGFDPDVADVDGDGSITITDALEIERYYVGLIDRFQAVDLSTLQFFPPIGNQVPIGTCTA
jgi:hypothetical protein